MYMIIVNYPDNFQLQIILNWLVTCKIRYKPKQVAVPTTGSDFRVVF